MVAIKTTKKHGNQKTFDTSTPQTLFQSEWLGIEKAVRFSGIISISKYCFLTSHCNSKEKISRQVEMISGISEIFLNQTDQEIS